MDCREARLLLDFARPLSSELEASDIEALESHLDDCPECGPLARAERRLDHHIGQAMRDVPTPPDLRDRLLNRLAVERDSWWRQRLLRYSGAVVVAATVFLVVGGLTFWRNQPGELSFEPWPGQPWQPTNSPDRVEAWFKKTHAMRITAPRKEDVEYRYLAHYGLETFQGKRVPVLLFIRDHPLGRDWARLYIVTDREFSNLQDLIGQSARASGGDRIEVIHNQAVEGVYYIVRYHGGLENWVFPNRDNPNA